MRKFAFKKQIFIALGLGSLVLFTGFHDKRRFADLSQSIDQQEKAWVDSLFNSMTDEERFGQLFVIRAHSDKDTTNDRQVDDMIRKYKPGGLCFFNVSNTGTPEKQAMLTNRYQATSSKVPLMISMDLEWGLGMRFKETLISYPKQIMLGAIQDNGLLYEMGVEVGKQCRRLGVHINFAPDADINNNAANPVINERSFGEDRHNVTAKSYQYMMGMQDANVLACAKHFPGHGDTNVDSHEDLPVIYHDRKHIDSLELFPFKMLTKNGIGSVMVAHLNVPALDARENRPTTLSKATVTDLLRKEMGFEGLIFTDAMGMKGVTKFFAPGQSDLEAFRAGNDISLLPDNIEASLAAIPVAIQNGTIDKNDLYTSVKRVLRAKYRLGMNKPQRVELENLRRDLTTPKAYNLKRRMIADAITLVRDDHHLVGFQEVSNLKIASLALGAVNKTVFQTYCGYYAPITHFNADKNLDSLTQSRLVDTLKNFDVVLVSIHETRSKASDKFGLTDKELDLIERLNVVTKVGLTMFGNPYSLRYFDRIPTLMDAYTEDPMVQEMAAQAWFGASDLKGKLSVTASPKAVFAQGIDKIYSSKRLSFGEPESVGMNSDTLALMNALIRDMINSGATPGCQVLVAKDNKIVWHKAYGHYTYEQTTPVTLESIYDLASVTKVAASTLSLMSLYEKGLFSLDAPMATYVPELAETNKKDLLTKEILAHHAGLQAWIPFYQQTLTLEKNPSPKIYRSVSEKGFEIPVAPNLYMNNRWVDTIWSQIFKSNLRDDKKYKYSDLALYLGARAIQNITKTSPDKYAESQFYKPMGLSTMTYTPWKKGLTLRCVPSEEDAYFRHQKIQGYVHDMGAAMIGGVSGHAGLFSNASDLAKIFQMLLNGGTYGSQTYLKVSTIKTFTTRYPLSKRRGIGFDMKEIDPKEILNMSALAGPNTFGHTGFTGICAWADPDQTLIFIFLSNRTYPNMENNKLISGDYRPKLQSIVYRATGH